MNNSGAAVSGGFQTAESLRNGGLPPSLKLRRARGDRRSLFASIPELANDRGLPAFSRSHAPVSSLGLQRCFMLELLDGRDPFLQHYVCRRANRRTLSSGL
jgi:hypothetical protein